MLPISVIRQIDEAAKEHGLPPAHLAAVVDVESNGIVFATVGNEQLPVILFEPHIFYRRLSGAKRDRAVALGLASAKWNKALYPKGQAARWRQLQNASLIDPVAALESASYGVGQVMGYHWKALGFASVTEFVETVKSGLLGQIDVMVRYIVVNQLDDELRDGRWAGFARGYNGAEYKANRYDTKLAAAAALYGGEAPAPTPKGMLRLGSKGARVRELQALLIRAGSALEIDGDFGPATRDALVAFQKLAGIRPDGVYGPETEGALGEYRQGAGERPGEQPIADVKGVREGAGGIVAGFGVETATAYVDKATEQLQQIPVVSPIIDYALAGLSLVAAGLAVAGVLWAVKSWLDSRKTVEA
ncbi:hypothetical protein GCM10007913_11930 [Devosia yakushimensis]|uniref:DUF3380 domain-containing protein n=1 Tax=Devosia yakushimensis TaxID=470028 RepID=A0ABQ5UCS5_9HYPH|nr:N-acetylmuramidase domain-containing protein [Devosia yakushimensis]GLQ09261.1 hypothetical protein GCM10007913_11930 [Devosia yakushimensis]